MLSKIKSYEDAVSFINTIPRFADKRDFEYMQAFYDYLDLEDNDRRVFHVAGTNGKGSSCAYLAAVNRCMGKKTGLFTSPHLVDIRERITLDGSMISKEDFFEAFSYIMEKYNSFLAIEEYSNYHPTFFAWLFFVAARFFYKKKAEVVIWETGLGGRLDASNVIHKKDICLITEIGLDHMEYLGDSIGQIAKEKAGIIRPNIPTVFVDRDNESSRVIRDKCFEVNSPIKMVKNAEKFIIKHSPQGIDFLFDSSYYNNAIFKIGTYAKYQVENALLALSALELVYDKQEMSLGNMQNGISSMKWPGRMEIIKKGVVFDGAHNVDGIKAMLESVSMDQCGGRRILLFSAVSDKQADIMLGLIYESALFDKVCLAHIDNSRGLSKESLEALALGESNVSIYDNAKDAYDKLSGSLEDDDILYVCGSLYLIAQLKS